MQWTAHRSGDSGVAPLSVEGVVVVVTVEVVVLTSDRVCKTNSLTALSFGSRPFLKHLLVLLKCCSLAPRPAEAHRGGRNNMSQNVKK